MFFSQSGLLCTDSIAQKIINSIEYFITCNVPLKRTLQPFPQGLPGYRKYMKNVAFLSLYLLSALVYADVYDKPIVIFVSPTEKEIEIAQKTYSDEEYSVWVDHGTYYSYQIEELMKKLGIKTISSDEMDFTFISNKKEYTFSLKDRDYQWSVIMFNGVDTPRLFHFPFDPDAESYYARGSNQ